MRTRINPYGISKSARALSKYLGAKRLLVTGSRFKGKYGDTVINWGNGRGDVGGARQINRLYDVQLANNKLSTLRVLTEANVDVPNWTTERSALVPEKLYMARTTLYGHSGQGIRLGEPYELPVTAPLYVEYIEKVAEYRVIVVNSKIVDFKKKKRRNNYEGTYGEHIWNHGSGYIFARNDIVVPIGCGKLGVDAVMALGLDFGAVDIIEDKVGKLYVLEVNTAFGIEGTTLELFGDALRSLL